jgi:hypothetical protein
MGYVAPAPPWSVTLGLYGTAAWRRCSKSATPKSSFRPVRPLVSAVPAELNRRCRLHLRNTSNSWRSDKSESLLVSDWGARKKMKRRKLKARS